MGHGVSKVVIVGDTFDHDAIKRVGSDMGLEVHTFDSAADPRVVAQETVPVSDAGPDASGIRFFLLPEVEPKSVKKYRALSKVNGEVLEDVDALDDEDLRDEDLEAWIQGNGVFPEKTASDKPSLDGIFGDLMGDDDEDDDSSEGSDSDLSVTDETVADAPVRRVISKAAPSIPAHMVEEGAEKDKPTESISDEPEAAPSMPPKPPQRSSDTGAPPVPVRKSTPPSPTPDDSSDTAPRSSIAQTTPPPSRAETVESSVPEVAPIPRRNRPAPPVNSARGQSADSPPPKNRPPLPPPLHEERPPVALPEPIHDEPQHYSGVDSLNHMLSEASEQNAQPFAQGNQPTPPAPHRQEESPARPYAAETSPPAYMGQNAGYREPQIPSASTPLDQPQIPWGQNPQPTTVPARDSQPLSDIQTTRMSESIARSSYRTGSTRSVTICVTGSHGGTGKSTTSWVAANATARELKQMGSDRPVYLIECDYENAKLEERMNLDGEHNLGIIADQLRVALKNKVEITPQFAAESVDMGTVKQSDTGLYVIPAPYNLRGSADWMVHAIGMAINVAKSRSAYVFLDAPNATSGDLDKRFSTIFRKWSNQIIVVTDSRHLQDTNRIIETMRTTMDVDAGALNVFLNMSTPEEVRNSARQLIARVVGEFPVFPEIQPYGSGSGWVGDAPPETIHAMYSRIPFTLFTLGISEMKSLGSIAGEDFRRPSMFHRMIMKIGMSATNRS